METPGNAWKRERETRDPRTTAACDPSGEGVSAAGSALLLGPASLSLPGVLSLPGMLSRAFSYSRPPACPPLSLQPHL